MMMGHEDMMKMHEQGCKDCAKQLRNGKADLNGVNSMMSNMMVKKMGINAPQMMGGDQYYYDNNIGPGD